MQQYWLLMTVLNVCPFESGTVYGATPSGEANTCFGSDDDDVWFTFEAVSTDAGVSLSNIVGSTTDLYHVVYEGNDCNNLTQLYCSDDESSVANGLTIGATYYVRVYSWTSKPASRCQFRHLCVRSSTACDNKHYALHS